MNNPTSVSKGIARLIPGLALFNGMKPGLLRQGSGYVIDWLWLLLAALMDQATIGSAGYTNRDRIPANRAGHARTRKAPKSL